MTRRMFSVPARCPATRGSPRWVAQRPLPSMMIATWRGTRPPEIGEMTSPSSSASHMPVAGRSDLKELGLLALGLGVDRGDMRIRQLLKLFFLALEIVL